MRKYKLFAVCVSMLLMVSQVALFATGCGNNNEEDVDYTAEEDDEYYDDEEYDEPQDEMSEETTYAAATGEGAVSSFIGEPFYDGVINDADDARDCVYAAMPLIGGDDSTELGTCTIYPTEDGVTYYSFQQVVGDLSVYAATAKLVVNKDGEAIGLVSSLVPNLEAPDADTWTISAGEAEEVIKKEYDGLTILSDLTEQTLLPSESDDAFHYVWVVYTDNIFSDVDTAYLAHYVDHSGNFLYSMPISNPGSADALAGSTAVFAFKDMETGTWSGTVTDNSGKKKDIEVPIMIDPETGMQILGDAQRQILCADQADFDYNDTLTPCASEDGEFDRESLLTYYGFIQIYDLFDECGWTGPDGDGTPSLILMNAVDEEGYPAENACYVGKQQGFQVFEFDTQNGYGEAIDVIGHEFTHCVTGTLMTTNLYMNDYGAINEGMSDILGNLAAMMVDEDDEPYLMGEKIQEGGLRVMGDPHQRQQPEFVWDEYYVPAALESTELNDNGGVHINSSLLNILSYMLGTEGMEPEDEFYYWMNVAMAMTPRTDYEQLAEILPWVMKNFGFEKYLDILQASIDYTRIATHDIPDTPGEGLSYVLFEYPEDQMEYNQDILVRYAFTDESDSFSTWPAADSGYVIAALPEGNYTLTLIKQDGESGEYSYVLYNDGEFVSIDEDTYSAILEGEGEDLGFGLEAGEIYELESDSLPEALAAY